MIVALFPLTSLTASHKHEDDPGSCSCCVWSGHHTKRWPRVHQLRSLRNCLSCFGAIEGPAKGGRYDSNTERVLHPAWSLDGSEWSCEHHGRPGLVETRSPFNCQQVLQQNWHRCCSEQGNSIPHWSFCATVPEETDQGGLFGLFGVQVATVDTSQNNYYLQIYIFPQVES